MLVMHLGGHWQQWGSMWLVSPLVFLSVFLLVFLLV